MRECVRPWHSSIPRAGSVFFERCIKNYRCRLRSCPSGRGGGLPPHSVLTPLWAGYRGLGQYGPGPDNWERPCAPRAAPRTPRHLPYWVPSPRYLP